MQCLVNFLCGAGMGKTTAIREVSRLLAGSIGKRVVICDTSNEIGGDGDVPHPGIGNARRLQVISTEKQHEVMIEAVENHMPHVCIAFAAVLSAADSARLPPCLLANRL
jgi:stage III sporulation protein SpoIIIAA